MTFGHREECQVISFQRVGVTAEVTITPTVQCGKIEVTCLPGTVAPDQPESSSRTRHKVRKKCKVTVFQELRIIVPVIFEAEADCEVKAVVCKSVSVVDGETRSLDSNSTESSSFGDTTDDESESDWESETDEEC